MRPVAATFLLLLIGTQTLAAEPNAFLIRLLGQRPGEGKTFACFRHDYDEAHLREHAGQNVQALSVLAVAYSSTGYSYQLRMGFRLRGHPEPLSSVAECGSADPKNAARRSGATCAGPIGVDRMALSVEGRSILMRIPAGVRLWKPGPPNPSDTLNDAFGPDDALFRLDRVPLARCNDQAFPYELPLTPRQK